MDKLIPVNDNKKTSGVAAISLYCFGLSPGCNAEVLRMSPNQVKALVAYYGGDPKILDPA